MKFFNSDVTTSTTVLFDAPGPRAKARTRVFNIAAILVFIAFAVYVLSVMGAKGQLEAEKWTDLFRKSLGFLLPARSSFNPAGGGYFGNYLYRFRCYLRHGTPGAEPRASLVRHHCG